MGALLLLHLTPSPSACSSIPRRSPLPKPLFSPPILHTPSPHGVDLPYARATGIFRQPKRRRNDFRVRTGDDDFEDNDFFDVEPGEEIDDPYMNMEYDADYARIMAKKELGQTLGAEEVEWLQGWDQDLVLDYRIDEKQFHKFSLLHCDFFIRKPPYGDIDLYDFSEMYITLPDTDAYAKPQVHAPMPQKYVRCRRSYFGARRVTQPKLPAGRARTPFAKCKWEAHKAFLIKHFNNRKSHDPEFFLDFEEIYVIDSKTRSITRAKVVVEVPGGRDRDRRNDLLIIRDAGTSFRIIDKSQKDDPGDVVQAKQWDRTRQDMEKHLSKLRDFDKSNWF